MKTDLVIPMFLENYRALYREIQENQNEKVMLVLGHVQKQIKMCPLVNELRLKMIQSRLLSV